MTRSNCWFLADRCFCQVFHDALWIFSLVDGATSFSSLECHWLFVNHNCAAVWPLLFLVIGRWTSIWRHKFIVLAWTCKNVVSESVEEIECLGVNPARRNTCRWVKFNSEEVFNWVGFGWFGLVLVSLLYKLKMSVQQKWSINKPNRVFGNCVSILISWIRLVVTWIRPNFLTFLRQQRSSSFGVGSWRYTFLSTMVFSLLRSHLSCFSDNWWSIFLQNHILKTLFSFSDFFSMSNPGNAFCYLLHFDLNNLVLQVYSLLVNLLLKNIHWLRLFMCHYLFLQLIKVKWYLFLSFFVNLL